MESIAPHVRGWLDSLQWIAIVYAGGMLLERLAPAERGQPLRRIGFNLLAGVIRARDGGTVEYQVEHPPWHVWQGTNPQFNCEIAQLYTPRFADLLCQPPKSAFLADGSAVAVMKPSRVS